MNTHRCSFTSAFPLKKIWARCSPVVYVVGFLFLPPSELLFVHLVQKLNFLNCLRRIKSAFLDRFILLRNCVLFLSRNKKRFASVNRSLVATSGVTLFMHMRSLKEQGEVIDYFMDVHLHLGNIFF